MYSGETPEASIADAVHAVVYAAPRVELKEMHMLREMLMHKVRISSSCLTSVSYSGRAADKLTSNLVLQDSQPNGADGAVRPDLFSITPTIQSTSLNRAQTRLVQTSTLHTEQRTGRCIPGRDCAGVRRGLGAGADIG